MKPTAPFDAFLAAHIPDQMKATPDGPWIEHAGACVLDHERGWQCCVECPIRADHNKRFGVQS